MHSSLVFVKKMAGPKHKSSPVNDVITAGATFYLNTPKHTQNTLKYTQIHHKIVFIVLVKGSNLYELFFIKKLKFHKFVTRVIKMINYIYYKHRYTNMAASNKYKHTQNSYGMCYLHTTNIFLPTLF